MVVALLTGALLAACSPLTADPIRVEAFVDVNEESCRGTEARVDTYSGWFDVEIALENVSDSKVLISTPATENGEDPVVASLSLPAEEIEPGDFVLVNARWSVTCYYGVPDAGWHEFTRVIEARSVECDKYGRCERVEAVERPVTLAVYVE